MKYVDEFRDRELASNLAANIRGEADASRRYRFMEFCGGHTHAIARYGVADLLPPNVQMIHGPGCPVCVLPVGRVDMAIRLALDSGVMLCTYGDVMRVPASDGLSLIRSKALGADVRIVYSPLDAVKLAIDNPQREVVFLAIGFETTTPPSALAIRQAAQKALKNFSVLCCHVLTPPAIMHILAAAEKPEEGTVAIDGFVGPAHVSVVIGSLPYERFAAIHRKPVVIAGFEPLDVMQAILMLVRQVNEGRAEIENEFTRAVSRRGNAVAQAVTAEIFKLRQSFEWRGLGEVGASALSIRPEFETFDAERRFDLTYRAVPDHKQCECGAILRGVKKPTDCKLFGVICTPENPMGSCMVSSEGSCAAHYSYGRFRDIPVVAS
ncbi:hydrogenase formation protein HypD [Paraburkholderia bryophila]|jgi:hydrogenase expression/formation protein HypD|uniref:Hydrogenase maturation factor n=1 Tax=Paraburkholderia bryophila TaxID=420952 RepID=A0A329B6U9_9BURK|nr:hydrogenase formation protein HypD [Paraburkholderia bryophila]RAS17387.1 hydrogenase expression/formation protein HypD [Paraburkholderia bryophila]